MAHSPPIEPFAPLPAWARRRGSRCSRYSPAPTVPRPIGLFPLPPSQEAAHLAEFLGGTLDLIVADAT